MQILQTLWTLLQTSLSKALNWVRQNPMTALVVLCAVLLMLLLNQCGTTRKLKSEVAQKEQQIKTEQQRSQNNLKVLHDTVQFVRTDSSYAKSILVAKQSEIALLDRELSDALAHVKTVTKEVPKLVYITDINTNISTSDVNTKVDHEGDSVSVGLLVDNQLFHLRTHTWLQFVPDSVNKSIGLQLVDKYGDGKPSLLDFSQNFRLQLAEVQGKDGLKRIYIQPVDLSGHAIDPKLLGITNIKGVDMIEQITPSVVTKTKAPRFALVFGPQGGLWVKNGKITPYAGVGITLGYNLIR
jgi:hypothetical protein